MERQGLEGKEKVIRYCVNHAISLSDRQIGKLEHYVASLSLWNKKHNLISRADIHNVWQKHILHSICWLAERSIPVGARILDIGSGAGIPGIPLAIVRGDLRVTLLDSIKKKTDSLSSIVSEVGVENARVVNCRAEGLAVDKKSQGAFDITIARAVAPLMDLVKWSIPLLSRKKPETDWTVASREVLTVIPPAVLALKGGDLSREVRDAARAFSNLRFEEVELRTSMLGLIEKKLVIVHC